jgi:hydrogenase/urease accessory protein HupE
MLSILKAFFMGRPKSNAARRSGTVKGSDVKSICLVDSEHALPTFVVALRASSRRISAHITSGVLALILLMTAAPAFAHVFQTSEAIIFFNRDATSYGIQLNMNLEAIMAGVDPEVRDTSESPKATEYNRLRNLPPDQLQAIFDAQRDTFMSKVHVELDGQPATLKIESEKFRDVGDLAKARNSTLHLNGALPPGAKVFTIQWAPENGKLTLRTVSVRSKSMRIEVVEKGMRSTPLVIDDLKARTIWDMIRDFMLIGYEHIVPKGLDHILFVTGIFLLSTKLRPILTQVTAFTVAHTVTLGLGTAGIINLPTSIVEPLIAASIVYVAVENIWRPTLSPWRPAVVFMFGLLHGLGFAGILKEFGIPEGEFLTGLLSFNVGVELGQLSVIALCYLLFGIWFGNKPWYRQRIIIPGSLIIAAIAAYWFVQRVTGWPTFQIGFS